MPVLQEMIYTAKRTDHSFNMVVVHSLSRFSRDATHSELYIRELRKAGVQLVSITEDVAQDASGEFLRKMLNIFDEHQSRENAKQIHRAMLENARQGFWNGAVPPYGYSTRNAQRRGAKKKKGLVINGGPASCERSSTLPMAATASPWGSRRSPPGSTSAASCAEGTSSRPAACISS